MLRNAQQVIRGIGDQDFGGYMIDKLSIQCQFCLNYGVKQEIAVAWQGNWYEENYRFGTRQYHIVVASKKLSPKKLPILFCIDRHCDFATSYKGAIFIDVDHKAFRKQDIVFYQYICSKAVDQVQLALN